MPEKNSTAQSSPASRGRSQRPFIPSLWRSLLPSLKGAPLAVYVAYWSHANEDDLAWPSLRSLSKTTGYGLDAVKKAKRELVASGLLVGVEQGRDGGQFARKVFRACTVVGKPCHGTVVASTVVGSTVVGKPCQE